MKKNRFMIMFIIFSIILFSAPIFASSYILACLKDREQIDYRQCDPTNPDFKVWTCNNDLCKQCVKLTDSQKICPARPDYCNQQGGGCSVLVNGTLDSTPPVLTVNNPVKDDIFTDKSVILDFDVSEESDIYYVDNIYGSGRRTRVCGGCDEYQGKKSFKEGFNNITFIAQDSIGLTDEESVTFFIDSKAPKIRKYSPKKGFANGSFYLEFEEQNPVSASLHYGSVVAFLNIANDCTSERGKYYCNRNFNVDAYDGQEISYWSEVEDIAGNTAVSKESTVSVDTTSPELTDIEFIQDGRYVNFNLLVNEINFNKIEYYDSSDSRPRWNTLCSSIRDNRCEKRKSFREGYHNLDLKVSDDAGNFNIYSIEFTVTN